MMIAQEKRGACRSCAGIVKEHMIFFTLIVQVGQLFVVFYGVKYYFYYTNKTIYRSIPFLESLRTKPSYSNNKSHGMLSITSL